MEKTHFNTHTKRFLEEGWHPNSKEELVEFLQEVQIGYISCRKAAEILLRDT